MTENRYEAEIAEGLEDIAYGEITEKLDVIKPKRKRGAVQFTFNGDIHTLSRLQTVSSVYRLLEYDVPRPRALLGHEHFHRMVDNIKDILTAAYHSFYISAAGSGSSVMQRIRTELSDHIGLSEADDNGDLLLRIRRSKHGWDVLIRLTPRPLATRDWRICDYEGALNGPTAYAMVNLSKPVASDVVVNLACGSGTLMIEGVTHTRPAHIIGIDNTDTALDCARQNLNQAGIDPLVTTLIKGDIRKSPLPDAIANTIYADLPFGQLTGSHEANLSLYPETLHEATRIAQKGAVFVLITHEVRLMEQILDKSTHWHTDRIIRVSLRGLHPRIYLLIKR